MRLNADSLRIVFAGDRYISVSILRFIIEQGTKPVCLLTSGDNRATHAKELIALCGHLDASRILKGNEFKTKSGVDLLKKLKADYIICVHFPYIIPKEVLEIPKLSVLNLHPAYLPYNRGWHTPTWAIWEETTYGATLHFMDEGIDTGDIIYQERIEMFPDDTADILYQRVKKLEEEVFKKAWPLIVSKNYIRQPQSSEEGTTHRREDIASIQFVDLKAQVKAGDLIKRLKALTTNDLKESAYFMAGGKSYRMQLRIIRDDS